MAAASPARVRALNERPIEPGGRYVLYWMIAARRLRSNLALDHAIDHARRLGRPLLVFEPLRVGYEYASDRFHVFAIPGMADHAAEAAAAGVTYYPHVEPQPGAARGLLRALSAEAAVVVADDHPCFHYPAMLAAGGREACVRAEAVDGNGLVPMRAAGGAFPTAFAFRRHLQAALPGALAERPVERPLRSPLPGPPARVRADVLARWPPATRALLADPAAGVADLPTDHAVCPAPLQGGSAAGRRALARFVGARLDAYAEARHDPDLDATSRLSPYLHWGHVGAHEAFAAVTAHVGWAAPDAFPRPSGRRAGWWGMPAGAEAFLDQLVTWRELGFNGCAHEPGYATFDAVPEWARRTLERHAADPRDPLYGLGQLERAETVDPLWNAAQRQLVREGRIQSYLRMLWGKKILEWTRTPEEALEAMVFLNDRHALDGRDPNSYAGITWVLGRYDRPWGPERPVFGTVRFMSSENTRRKAHVAAYLERYAAAS